MESYFTALVALAIGAAFLAKPQHWARRAVDSVPIAGGPLAQLAWAVITVLLGAALIALAVYIFLEGAG